MMIRPPLCVLLLTCAARGSVVLEPSSSRPLATTTLKLFGPQTFSLNATGSPLIELSAADLAQIQRDGRASTDVAGAIVVFNFADIPNPASEWLWYIALERAGATAVLTTTTLFRIPGGLYHANDGSTRSSGLTRSGAMPMLQVAWWDVSDLVEAARAGATVSLQLEPSVNKFRPFWHSWAWVLGIRGLMPLLGFTAGGVALKNLRAHIRLGGRSILWPPTKPVMVLVSEMFVCPLLGVFCVGGPGGSTSTWTFSKEQFFASMLTGWSLFTTLIMAVGAMSCASAPARSRFLALFLLCLRRPA